VSADGSATAFILLDTKVKSLGWAPGLRIQEGVLKTLAYLQANPWVFDRRR
jgi:UDP-glucose 4-epimerase